MKFFFLLLFLLSSCSMLAQNAQELRSKAAKLEKEGNWKDAYEVRVRLLGEVNDGASGKDLEKAVVDLLQLGKEADIDLMLAEQTGAKPENASFLRAGAEVYLGLSHHGTILDNEFQRGWVRGGEYRDVSEVDRLRALQLYVQAWKVSGDDKKLTVEILEGLRRGLLFGRSGQGGMWKLSLLTDLTQEPDYLGEHDVVTSQGAPVDDEGKPIYFSVADSWETAVSDGARWRFLEGELARLDAAAGHRARYEWWEYCHQNYGVNTLSSFSWWGKAEVAETEGILQVSSLKETETVARLANGVKRFELREDYQFIPGLRVLMKEGKGGVFADAGDRLVSILLNRAQYPAAARALDEVILLHGKGDDDRRAKLLGQIRGNWSEFGSTPTYYAAEPVEVPFSFRNAGKVDLTLTELKDEQVMKDIIDYLKAAPKELDYNRTNFGSLGRKLVEGKFKKYLGKEVRKWTEELSPPEDHRTGVVSLDLGKLAPGAYLLRSSVEGGNTAWIVIWVRDLVLLNRAEAEGEVFYLVDAKRGQPVEGEIEFFGFRIEAIAQRKGQRRHEVITTQFKKKTDEAGRVVLESKDKWDRMRWQVIARAGERRAYLGDRSFRWESPRTRDQDRTQKTYVITDRPVYQPEQKVYFKLWAGEARYDLDEVSVYAGKRATVEIRDPKNSVVFEEKNLVVDEYGGLEFDYQLPEDAALGNYRVRVVGEVPNGWLSFRVEEYKKPEYEVTVEAPTDPVALGEKFTATVKATYFHGAPVSEATVRITVQRSFFEDRWFPSRPWDWLYGSGYWWSYPEYSWYPGWSRWGCVRPSPPWWRGGRVAPPELVLEQTGPIGPGGEVKVELDTSVAKLVHPDQDHRYTITAEVVDASRRTIVGNGAVLAGREPFEVTVWLDRGYARTGDPVSAEFAARTLDGKEVEGKATARLFAVSLDADGKIVEKEVKKWNLKDESEWNFQTTQSGQYRLEVEFTDKKGRSQVGATIFSVRGEDMEEGDFRFNPIELIPDKQAYKPGDTVKLLVNVDQPNSRVWLFIRPSQGAKEAETKIIRVRKQSQVTELPVTLSDMPNFFVEAVTVAEGKVHSTTTEIVLPPEKKALTVEVLPAKSKLKPQEKTSLTIKLTDHRGKPYQGSAAISIYDKSLEYISGGSNVQEIVPFFWKWTRSYYRRGMENSQNLRGYHLQLPDTERLQTLGIFGGLVGMERDESAGFGRLGGDLEGGMMTRSARGGAGGMPMPMAVPAMLSESADAFGSDAEAKSGVAVEEQAPEIMVRSEFADLLKWVGSVETDEKGEATIELEMPDNLTTWKIKTWAMGKGTKVGEGSAEIITSKDLIIRLQAPRFFVEKDEVTLSAIVHNYHKEAKEVSVSLELDGDQLVGPGTTETRVAIPSQGETRVDWVAQVKKEGEVTIRMKALAAGDSDAMEMKFPVYVHGMAKTESYSRAIAPDGDSAKIEFEIPEERRPAESRLIVNYSPSIATAMVDALPYLASYPYGCTEQTLNRFLPTLTTHHLLKEMGYDLASIRDKRAQLNPQKIGDPQERAADWQPKGLHWNPVWDEKEVAKMTKAGLAALSEQQNPDGGWGWFSAFGHRSYPHTTAVIVHGLILVKETGVALPDGMLENGISWLERYEAKETERIANWKKRKENTKPQPDAIDALVRFILGEAKKDNAWMLGYLFRDKIDQPLYAKALIGLEYHRLGQKEKRDALIKNLRQFLKTDEENQTAYLDLPNQNYWWYWYGSNFEAQAWFLKLLAAAEPESADTRGLAKYLINSRSNSTHWDSTRDTAYCLEALADFIKATGEAEPDLTVEVLLDGKLLKTVEINKENLFTFDSTALVAGDILSSGKHTVELRKKGTGPLYANAYVEYFTLEDFITKAGLEIKVERQFYKLVPEVKDIDAVDSKGQVINQKKSAFKRVPLKSGDAVASGDLIEVELSIESKNDYEYLIFEDWKAAGLEAVEVRSGYNPNGLGAYMELRDEKVALFVQNMPRGRHNLSYRLRAEIPGKFSALPTVGQGLYAPELRANSDEMKIQVTEN